MSQRIKSALYLLSFIIAALIYYNETEADQAPQQVEMASLDMEEVSDTETFD